jgi:hypothetical protein
LASGVMAGPIWFRLMSNGSQAIVEAFDLGGDCGDTRETVIRSCLCSGLDLSGVVTRQIGCVPGDVQHRPEAFDGLSAFRSHL